MKTKFLGLLLSIPLLLVACDEGFSLDDSDLNLISVDSESSINLSLYPDNVANGTVSVNVFEESMRLIDGITPSLDKINALQKRLNENTLLRTDSEFKAEFVSAIEDYQIFIKGLYPSPSTEADFEINKSFSEILYYSELLGQSLRDYTGSYEIHHRADANKYAQSIKTSYIVFIDKLDKYKLFTDSE